MNEEDWFDLDRATFMQRWYSDEYARNAYSGGAGVVQSLMHRSLEKAHSAATHFPRVLEIGGNVGEHLDYVNHSFDEYILSDLYDSIPEHDKAALASRNVSFAVADATSMPWQDHSFDRVLNTCVIHHVSDPEQALGEIRRVLKPGGVADVFLPADPGLAFRLARRIGPIRTAQKSGLGNVKRLVDARDHRNHIGALRVLVRHVFRHDDVRERVYPIPKLTWNLSLFHTYRITKRF